MSTEADQLAGGVPSPPGIVSLKKEDAGRVSESLTRLALRRLRHDYLTLVALSILALFTVLSIMAPVFESVLDISYRTVDLGNTFAPINSPEHVLGTDDLGRDEFARLLYGGRISLSIGFWSAVLSLVIGMTLGVITGYYQGTSLGIVDDLMMWFITTLNSIPGIFLLIIVAAVLKPSVTNLILVLALLSWTGTMRLVRGETLSQRSREYVIAARATGSNVIRTMFVHILPNIFSVLIVTLAIAIGNFILVEAALSFLSLGVTEPTPSWGNMLTNAQVFFRKGPHLAIMPGVLISVTVLCLYLIGDGLRDAFDPQAVRKK